MLIATMASIVHTNQAAADILCMGKRRGENSINIMVWSVLVINKVQQSVVNRVQGTTIRRGEGTAISPKSVAVSVQLSVVVTQLQQVNHRTAERADDIRGLFRAR